MDVCFSFINCLVTGVCTCVVLTYMIGMFTFLTPTCYYSLNVMLISLSILLDSVINVNLFINIASTK